MTKIEIRCSEETKKMWKEMMFIYKQHRLTAEDLIRDALRLLKEHHYPKIGLVY